MTTTMSRDQDQLKYDMDQYTGVTKDICKNALSCVSHGQIIGLSLFARSARILWHDDAIINCNYSKHDFVILGAH